MAVEKEGTTTNLDGRVQRIRLATVPPAPVLDGLQLASELGRRLGLDLPQDAASAFRNMAGDRDGFTGIAWEEIGERGVRPQPPPLGPPPPVPHLGEGEQHGTVVVAYRQLMSGPAVENTPALQFQRRNGIEIAHVDAQALGIATGDRVEVEYNGSVATGPALVRRGLMPGVVRMPATIPHVGPAALRAAVEETAGA
jgi:anaerobic selenocysteine-containing dehydrogenase